MPVIEGVTGLMEYSVTGAPAAGTDAVQTISITGTAISGTFVVKHEGHLAAAIAWNSTAAAIDTILEALKSIGAGGIVASGGPLPGTPVVITWGGIHAKKKVGVIEIVANNLAGTSPVPVVTNTTPGVDCAFRGVGKGALIVNTADGTVYQCSAITNGIPTWTAR